MAKKPATAVEDVKAALEYKRPEVSMVPDEDLLSTGSTLLDLGLSGRIAGGFAKGMYFIVAGKSGAGKTFLYMTCFAEANINPNFEGYRFIANMPEDGSKMDWAAYFGPTCAARIEAPAYEDGLPKYSRTYEEFYDHAMACFKAGPCIYVLDSENSLTAEDDLVLYAEQEKARKKIEEGKDAKIPDSYGTARAKVHSQRMPSLIGAMQESRSILILVCQTRQNVGGGMFDEKEIKGGGLALTYYAQAEMWLNPGPDLKKPAGKDLELIVGITSHIRVKKNRLSGKDRSVSIPIFDTAGLDDLGSCIDYIVKTGHWKRRTGGIIEAHEFMEDLKKDDLIRWIEENNEEAALKAITQEAWNKMEEEVKIERKQKYS